MKGYSQTIIVFDKNSKKEIKDFTIFIPSVNQYIYSDKQKKIPNLKGLYNGKKIIVSHTSYIHKSITISSLAREIDTIIISLAQNHSTLPVVTIKRKKRYLTINKLKKNLYSLDYPLLLNYPFLKKYFSQYCQVHSESFINSLQLEKNFVEEAVYIYSISKKNNNLKNINFWLSIRSIFESEYKTQELLSHSEMLVYQVSIYKATKNLESQKNLCTKFKYIPGERIFTLIDTSQRDLVDKDKVLLSKGAIKKYYKIQDSITHILISYDLVDKKINIPDEGFFISYKPINIPQKTQERLLENQKYLQSGFSRISISGGITKGGFGKAIPVFIRNEEYNQWVDITFSKIRDPIYKNPEYKKLNRMQRLGMPQEKIGKFRQELEKKHYDKVVDDLFNNPNGKEHFMYPLYELTISY